MRTEELVDLVGPVLADGEFELVECSISRTSKSQTFRISIDRAGGVTIDDCARVSRGIAHLLDAHPLLRGAYQLEVSSAGMNRPIRTPEHFVRFAGEEVRLEFTGAEGPVRLCGEIGPVEGDSVSIRLANGESRPVPLSRIVRASLHMDPWKRRQGPEARGAGSQPGSGEQPATGAQRRSRPKQTGGRNAKRKDGQRHG